MARLNSRSKLGDYFVGFSLVTRKQVETCHKSMRPGQMLGHALVRANLCDAQMCERVANVQRLCQKTAAQRGTDFVLNEKSFIGDILVALGSITKEQNEFWLKHQEEERSKGNVPMRLGELLVAQGVCTAAERDLGMQVQNWLRGVK
ncbi:MAG TPA: hypothetical protein V6C81_12115 [Planktothrix sp.]